jgi:hypothetical protein
MEVRDSELPPRPPGVVNALVKGFNAVAGNVSVIFFPVALDVFLWLGPRLRIYNLIEPYLAQISLMQSSAAAPIPYDPDQLGRGFNLFSFLRTFPIGVFSLLSSIRLLSSNFEEIKNAAIGTTPFGPRLDVEMENIALILLVIAGLTLVGWFFGSMYFYAVARIAVQTDHRPALGRALFHGALLNGFWTVMVGLLTVMAVIGLTSLAVVSLLLAAVVQILFSLVALWFAVPVFFSAHGVFIEAQNAFVSIWKNLQMMRFGLPPLGWFALIAVVINQGMNLLWSVAPADSWMTLVGIFGHAFISTSLLAASFIFYRELSSWVEEALQWLKAHQITSARA